MAFFCCNKKTQHAQKCRKSEPWLLTTSWLNAQQLQDILAYFQLLLVSRRMTLQPRACNWQKRSRKNAMESLNHVAASYAAIMPNHAAITPTLATIAPKYGATTQQVLDTFDWPDRGCAKKQHGCPCIAYQSWTTREPQLSVGVVRSTTSLQWVKIAYYQWIGFVGKIWNRKAPWSSWENLWFPKFPVSIFPTKPIHCLLGLGWSEALKNMLKPSAPPSGSFFWATHMNHIIPPKKSL